MFDFSTPWKRANIEINSCPLAITDMKHHELCTSTNISLLVTFMPGDNKRQMC